VKKTDLRGKHDLGEIIGLAWRVYARNFGPMFLIALTTVPLQVLAAVLQDRIDSRDAAALATAPLQLAGALVTVIATGALIHAVNDVATGTPPTFTRSIDAAFERFGRLLTTNLLAGILAMLSLIALPYFAVRWTFGAQAVMLEDKRNWGALDASSSIVKGQWWRTFGILLMIVLVAVGPSIMASAAGVLPALASSTIIAAALALTIPFLLAAQTLLYYDLRSRKAPPTQIEVPVDAPEGEPQPGSDDQPAG
jgi:hypothetical protein